MPTQEGSRTHYTTFETYTVMRTLLLFFFLGLSLFSVAQKKESSISFGPSIGIPPDLRGSWGSGASLRGYIGTSKRGAVLVNSGVLFYPSLYEGRTRAASQLKVGYKTQILHPNLFLYGDGGIMLTYGTPWGNNTDPAAAVGVGYSLPVGVGKYVDITPSWNFRLRSYPNPWIVNNTRLELHFGYRFAFK